jgi:DNA-directed RNA polymerase subunit RPC12/RpoP
MGWRFYRRTKLIGGLGINWSKSGASLSVRTPFGSVNTRGGVSVRTPIKGLQYRFNWSGASKQEAVNQFTAECDTLFAQARDFEERGKLLNRWNGVDVKYPAPEFDDLCREFSDVLSLAKELQESVDCLKEISRTYNLGLIGRVQQAEKCLRLDDNIRQIEENLAVFEKEKREYLAKLPAPSPESTIMKFYCRECHQPLEIDKSYLGDEIDCPICEQKTLVLVPTSEDEAWA